MFDMNDAEPQRSTDLIPDGTFAKVKLSIRRRGVDGQSEIDRGLLKAAVSSDAKMLDCEIAITDGPYAGRKLWQMYTVQGGKLDDKGVSIGWKISKSAFRAMIDSATGLDPNDMSDTAKAKRVIGGLAHLDGIVFVAKIKIEPANDPKYSDQNRIDHVVLPTEPEWRTVMDGGTVPAKPSIRRAAKAPATEVQPGWNQGATAQPAGAAAAPAWASATSGAAPAQAPAAAAQPSSGASAGGPAWLNG